MVYCVAFNCKNSSFKNQPKDQKVPFFSFPENNPLRQIWVENVRRKNWKPSKSSKLCSRHFEDICFVQNLMVLESIGWKATRLRLKRKYKGWKCLHTSQRSQFCWYLRRLNHARMKCQKRFPAVNICQRLKHIGLYPRCIKHNIKFSFFLGWIHK